MLLCLSESEMPLIHHLQSTDILMLLLNVAARVYFASQLSIEITNSPESLLDPSNPMPSINLKTYKSTFDNQILVHHSSDA